MPTSATTERPTRGSGQDGFTLVELTLALAILGLVAALALPGARPTAGPAALRANAYQAAALLRADRTTAQRTGRTVETIYDPAARTLSSGASPDRVVLPPAIAARVAGAAGRFRFYPDGRSSGGALQLASGVARLDLVVDGFTSAVAIKAPGRAGG